MRGIKGFKIPIPLSYSAFLYAVLLSYTENSYTAKIPTPKIPVTKGAKGVTGRVLSGIRTFEKFTFGVCAVPKRVKTRGT